MIQVKIVERQGQSMIVQWYNEDGRPRRTIVPHALVAEYEHGMGGVDEVVLMRGMDIGEDWEKFIGEVNVTQDGIADALREAGFWDWRDIEHDPRKAQKAIDDFVNVRAATLARYARQQEV